MTAWQQAARIGTRVQLLLAALGTTRCVALALCGIALVLWLGPRAQMQQRLLHEQAALQRLQHSAPPAPHALQLAQNDPAVRMAALRDVLPEPAHAEQQLKTLFALAQRHGVALQTAEYRQSVDRANQLRSWQITVPLHASYSALRGFIEQVLLTMPYAAVNELRFKRDAIGNPALEARLRITLFLNDAPGAHAERVQ